METPLLVYDGRCGFCRRFIPRWQQLTGERVRYVAFLPDGDDEERDPLPGITPEALRTAVHLRLPDGRIVSGAAAVAEAGAYTGRTPVFRTLYRRLPGFAPLADLGYRVVARNRRLAHELTGIFVGPDLRRPRQVLVRWLFLRMLGLTTLCAVISWWVQVDGLVGSHGIAPAADYLRRAGKYAIEQGWSPLETVHQFPTFAWPEATDAALHTLCALATLGGALLFLNVLPGAGILLAWSCYLSLVTTGGVFMGYQWDALLLESLFAALFVVPWRGIRPGLAQDRAPSWAGVWLIRFLVLKLMFLSGDVKLLSDDPVWADMTALDYHYWTQPLPAWTSYLADHAPQWTRDLSIRVMFAIELVSPWLILSGLRRLRYVAAFGAFTLMLAIGVTGNYGYFNLLAFTLAIMVLDDNVLRALVPRRLRARVPDSQDFAHRRPPVPWRIPTAVAAGLLALASLAAFLQRMERADNPEPPPSASAPLTFTYPVGFVQPLDVTRADVLAFVAPLHLTSSYGLFATMTTERPEIEVQGSRDGVEWRDYRFAWKPGELDAAPSFAGPHMPRLDWQMWFAALRGDCRHASWYLAFARRLLEGDADVLALMGPSPFPDGAPRYLRSKLWYYTFATAEQHAATGAYWSREPAGRDFCPTLALDGGKLHAVELP